MSHAPLPSNPPSRRLRLTVAAIAVGGLLAVLVVIAYGMHRVTQIGSQVRANQKRNTAALCAIRSDFQAATRNLGGYLQEHPHGGAVALISQSVLNDRQTVRLLQALPCDRH